MTAQQRGKDFRDGVDECQSRLEHAHVIVGLEGQRRPLPEDPHEDTASNKFDAFRESRATYGKYIFSLYRYVGIQSNVTRLGVF